MNQIKNIIKRILNNNGRGWTVGAIIKMTILAVVALIALSIIIAMFKWVFDINDNDDKYERYGYEQERHEERGGRDDGYYGSNTADYIRSTIGSTIRNVTNELSDGLMAPRDKMLSQEIGIMPVPIEMVPVSKDAEDFETREYRASYEKRSIDKTCKKFEELKPLEYVVFENANKSNEYCNYRFKVEVNREQEILLLIESLDPKDFNANTFTIERSITNNTNEIEILEKKIEMLDSLLESAKEKYNKLSTSGNATALVQAINNEINLIERITNQKLSVQSRIDRLTNSTSVQEERIDYSQFNISVSERKLVDWGGILEQWKYAFERFGSEISSAVQGLTIGLILFAFTIVKFIAYISISILAVVVTTRVLWALTKRIWRK